MTAAQHQCCYERSYSKRRGKSKRAVAAQQAAAQVQHVLS